MYYVWQASKASENKLCVKDMELFSIPSSIVKQIPECSKVYHKKIARAGTLKKLAF